MTTEPCQLRAIVAPTGDGRLQAQLLELDIAVVGANIDEILTEVAHAIIVSYEVALEHNEAPFALIADAPQMLKSKWRQAASGNTRCFHLPEDVAMALATALRKRKPIRSIVYGGTSWTESLSMDMDEPSQPTNSATWSQLIEALKSHGVTIARTKTGYYLQRAHGQGGTILHFPLPSKFEPNDPDKLGLPGPMVIDSIQRNLDLQLKGWYHVL
jgi:hypothetical protein